MCTETEATLEEKLMAQLQTLGFEKTMIRDEEGLKSNLKLQLEKHNRTQFSDNEFDKIFNKLQKGNLFDKAKTLRGRLDYTKDDDTVGYIELINQVQWCKNQYQVAQQITMQGKYTNRYDVTLLINGFPLVQIELKRRGIEIKEAFNQVNRYDCHSYGTGYGLFNYIQLFIISNGVNTKYFANNPNKQRDFKQTFYWADTDNHKITQLSEFAEVFLEKCQLSKIITQYTVLNETTKSLMVLRPYQYYAVEAIVNQVRNTDKDGYIWHTTGSGKTLTSFKAAQILTEMPQIDKVVFVVDRKDLDYQTIEEFNSFKEGSVDATNNTKTLVKQFADDKVKLTVTTLQKLNTAISKKQHLAKMEALRDKPIIFIFDECHRSQFGKTHKQITEFFNNAQLFGFTGTPIFAKNATKNALGKRTTKDLFGECLHKYVVTDAIRDENVLKFAIEYIRTFKMKDGVRDIEVEAIDKAEAMMAPQRLNNIVDYIINNHKRKTHNCQFNAIFCVSDIETLAKYYELFKQKEHDGEHNLKIATIFSYQANPDISDDTGFIEDDMINGVDEGKNSNPLQRDKLEQYIKDYNSRYKTNWSTDTFYKYYQDIGKRVKKHKENRLLNQEIDILLVVNMYLTGFDSKQLNTIYVDKNLKYHGLLQAYSRTNRILGQKKSQGNVVSFRNLKRETDAAIKLFANKEAIETILLAPYEDYIVQFNEAVENLQAITPTIDSVNALLTEEDEAQFIQAFRQLMRLKNVLECFTEFSFDDLSMTKQTFENFKSKYLDLYDKVRHNNTKEKISILDDLDFELELLHRDTINVTYIIKLLASLKDSNPDEQAKQRNAIFNLLDSEAQLRSKKELIERFINEHFPRINKSTDIDDVFERYWTEQKQSALHQLAESESLNQSELEALISDYLFTEKLPLRDDIISALNERPRLKERKPIAERILTKIQTFIETFIDGVG